LSALANDWLDCAVAPPLIGVIAGLAMLPLPKSNEIVGAVFPENNTVPVKDWFCPVVVLDSDGLRLHDKLVLQVEDGAPLTLR